jgi:hypothetical protein
MVYKVKKKIQKPYEVRYVIEKGRFKFPKNLYRYFKTKKEAVSFAKKVDKRKDIYPTETSIVKLTPQNIR